jgi:predicted ATP-binding protein involved in virulence
MHIEHLELKNYAGFTDFSLDFPKGNLAVFIGENGSGKTSIISAIDMLLQEANYLIFNKKKRTEISNDLVKDENKELKIKINLNLNEDILFEWGYKKMYDKEYNYYTNISAFYLNPEEKEFKKKLRLYFAKKDNLNKILPFFVCFYSVIEEDKSINSFIDWYIQSVYHESYLIQKYSQKYNLKAAIDLAIETFTNIKVDTKIAENKKELEVFFTKNDTELSFMQLSEGEKKTIFLISKILSHFVFPFEENGTNLLDFQGIVLIDEIETHLHPRWQREILPNLTKTFPNVQFIVTTHSPQVISSVPKEAVFLLKDFQAIPVQAFTQGRDTNSLLTEVFDIPIRPAEDMKMLGNFYAAIANEDEKMAEEILQEMAEKWGDLDSEVIKARMDFEELLNEKVLE